jgi:hypothetical protein
MSEEYEPGRRAYEIWVAAMDAQHAGCDVWSDQDGAEQAAWAAVEAQLADGGAEHPACDAHRWWAVVKHYGSFAYGFAATDDGLRVYDDASEFEYAKAQEFG